MIPPLDFVFRLFNGAVTIAIASLLLSIFGKTNRRFYFYWGIGYSLYGVNIIIRMLTPTELGISFFGIIAFLLLMLGFAMMVAGIGELVNRTRAFLASSLSILLTFRFNCDKKNLKDYLKKGGSNETKKT